MLNPITTLFSYYLSRLLRSFVSMAINIVTRMDESEFDVIIADDDEQLQFLLCSEKMSSYDIIDDDSIMPIQIDDKYTTNISVGGTGSTIMVAGSFYIPKYIEKKPLGEDASFICVKEQTIGVADGVGGWAKKGIDSGEYSRELMKNAESAVIKQKLDDTSTSIDLMKVLNEALLNTKAKGSSTACILNLDNDTLRAINVGDSGFVVIRDGVIVYKSEIQQSRFNCPFQLGNGRGLDDSSVAMEVSVPVKAGDIVVLGTDGLFDNVHDFELETIVNGGVDSWDTDVPETLAWRIAQYALDNSKDKEIYTPFSRECFKAGVEHSGGKCDDITVIVANIWPC
ncbi:hypothetical protein RND71_007679 [Anisodus tanguticus]|uniref:Protein phosphatase n=1 Tax=Anisodus tanguticus TaxID=243964 RepID=A0AAE1VTQ7_9SOLA|nr:hypothetical protein RND71_007679 [Anisodus tanguticus]